MTTTKAPPAAVSARRKPTQKRAKERVEKILATASEMISETGSDAVRMTELAARAGVPIGSLYQYFPDKGAILRTLAVRFMEATQEMLAALVDDIKTADDALVNVDFAIDGYYATVLNEPVIRDVWSGTQSDKVLQALDIEDSRENGRIFYEGLKRFVDPAEHTRFEASCFLIMQMAGAATRLAIAVEKEEGDLLMVEFRRIVRDELVSFIARGPTAAS